MKIIDDIINALDKYHKDLEDAKYWGGPTINPPFPFTKYQLIQLVNVLQHYRDNHKVCIQALEKIRDKEIRSIMDGVIVHDLAAGALKNNEILEKASM